MPLRVLNVSVVVTATHHTPSILHPAFLAAQKIVPEGWQTADPPICTPPLSVVKYENGVVFTADPGKLQVIDNRPGDTPNESPVTDLASKYIAILPHVRYSGVGINLKGFVELPDAEAYLMEKFLKPGPWSEPPLAAEGVGIKLVFSADGARLILTVDAGSVASSTEPERTGILVDANYHTDVSETDCVAAATTAIEHFPRYCSDFASTVPTVLGLRG